MILGIGTDIVEIERIQTALQRTPKLAERILESREYQTFQSVESKARFLAKRFAAKEATAKALGTGIARGVSWKDISIDQDELGKPLLALSGGALDVAQRLGVTDWHLSYSDEKQYVVAQVIAEKR